MSIYQWDTACDWDRREDIALKQCEESGSLKLSSEEAGGVGGFFSLQLLALGSSHHQQQGGWEQWEALQAASKAGLPRSN